jgi:hypothetical protein
MAGLLKKDWKFNPLTRCKVPHRQESVNAHIQRDGTGTACHEPGGDPHPGRKGN